MRTIPRIIGIYGPAAGETLQRAVLGMVRYQEENVHNQIRDFRTANLSEGLPQTPPWRERCDAVIVAIARRAGMNDAATADWVLSGEVPAVSITFDWRDPRVPRVGVPQEALAILAARHLLACDCKSYLFLGFADSTGSARRREGFSAELARHGRRALAHEMHVPMLGSLEDESVALHEGELINMIRQLPKPLGVWALNDNFAKCIYTICEKLSLAIPQQVRIVGNGDLALARILNPRLTSIRTPGEAVGYRAMEFLANLLQGKRPTESREVEGAELVARESTAPAKISRDKMSTARAYIARHACEGVSVAEVAEVLNLNRRSFDRSFRETVGHSAGEEINRIRWERSQDLLRQGDLSIGCIAGMVGFEETAAFSKFFHKCAGHSPSEYRARLKEQPVAISSAQKKKAQKSRSQGRKKGGVKR